MEDDLELERQLQAQPTEFKDGFGWKAVLGGLFVGFLIVPGDMFMDLVLGQHMAGVSKWVTLILFIEIAKRCRKELTKQEIFILFAFAGAVLSQAGIEGSFIRMQYYVQSPAADMFEIADRIPIWVAPPPGSEAYALRSLLHRDWWPHLMLMAVTLLWGRFNFYSLGYAIFRITSDVERLPFPMAPIAAQGITALAESEKETWRWRCFTIGAAIGLAFGVIYIGIPTLTTIVFDTRLEILPIPFKDLTRNTQKILPAVPLALMTNLGQVFTGFVLPFWMVVGTFASAVIGQLFMNPILYENGFLPTWQPGMGYIDTKVANWLDFWFSFGIGTAFGCAVIGFWAAGRALYKSNKDKVPGKGMKILEPPKGRGDIPIPLALLFYVVSTTGTVILCHYLVPKFPIWILLAFGFIYTPLISYISARLIGLTGHASGFPFVKESTFILTGYKGVDIWNAPIPMGDMGRASQQFRECELTGTSFLSKFKAVTLAIPLAVFVGILFWSFIWKMGEIPSAAYPYAAEFWPQDAFQMCVWWTATTTGNDFFLEIVKPWRIFWGFLYVLIAYPVMVLFGLPQLFLWGTVRGLAGDPMDALPEFAAGMVGRYYFAKKLGRTNWAQYTPILAAGFGCGMGLIGMTCIAVKLIASAITQLPY